MRKVSAAVAPKTQRRVTASVSLVGRDRTGVVARVTQFLFQNAANIESLEEQVQRGRFHMDLVASWDADALGEAARRRVQEGLAAIGRDVRMETRVRFHRARGRPRMAVLVTKEPHCLDAVLAASRRGRIGARPVLVVGNRPELGRTARRAGVAFAHVPWSAPARAEARLRRLLDDHDVDFVVLARFMKILSPDLCWRYRNRIINIHPSLLPAFPGATAYRQAYEKGVRVVGATAHFVTPDLDQGPIIMQDAFRVRPDEPLERIRARGQALEARVLLEAIDLYVRKRLDVHWGRVWSA